MLLSYGVGEDSWESLGLRGDQTSQSERKSVLTIYWKDWCWNWSSNTFLPSDVKSQLIGKDLDAGKDWRKEEKGATEDEMVGWHHQLDRHEFEQVPGVGEGQGSLACCSTWGRRVGHDWVTELDWLMEYREEKKNLTLENEPPVFLNIGFIFNKMWACWDLPGGPVVKISLSNAGGAGSIPGQGAKTPQALRPKQQQEKKKTHNGKSM